jgi:pimeloyl-ACP methyl ester carboxylesterase
MLPALQRWHSSGSYFDFNGHGIFFKKEDIRRKEWLLLIHGFPTASWDYAPIWDTLAKKYNLITADLLGYGFSAKPKDHTYSIIEQADMLEALLKKEKIKTYHILSHDYGVSVAQELLARQLGKKSPALSVCFLNGGLYPEFHKPLLIQKLMLTKLGPLLARFFTKQKLKASFDTIFGERKATAQELEEFWQLIEYNNGRQIVPKMLRYLIERRQNRERWVHGTENTSVPVLMINGPLDPISGAHLAKAFAERNPRAKVVSLPGVGHYPQVEAPAKVADAYLKFLLRR